jgi:hypothetical protein
MKKFHLLKLLFLLFFFGLTVFSAYSQKIGQTKKLSLLLKGCPEGYQIGFLQFTDVKTNKPVEISWNDFVADCNSGLSKQILFNDKSLIGKKFDVEFIYMTHLRNEGAADYVRTGWVVASIYKMGTNPPKKNIIFPKVGKVIDPEGYVNIRKEMNVNSQIVGRLDRKYDIDADDDAVYYFYPCTGANWYQVREENDNANNIVGYVYKNRIQIIYK